MKNALLGKVFEILITLAVPVFLFILNQIKGFVARFIKAKVDHEAAEKILLQLSEAAFGAVASVQHLADTMKEAASDGKLSDDEVDVLKDKALGLLKDNLGPKLLAELEEIYGELDPTLNQAIEAALQSYIKKN